MISFICLHMYIYIYIIYIYVRVGVCDTYIMLNIYKKKTDFSNRLDTRDLMQTFDQRIVQPAIGLKISPVLAIDSP